MKDDKLLRLSILAHEVALQTGTQAPAERPEFMHLPMTVEAGVPVFDGPLMREDQIDDTIETLERMTRVKRAQNTREQIEEYMFAYGKYGLRKKDVAEALNMNEINVRRAMDALVAEGKVQVREEKTRGAGSRRKRYFWNGAELATTGGVPVSVSSDGTVQVREESSDTIQVRLDAPTKRSMSGVLHHGKWVYSLACSCEQCQGAFDTWLESEEVSRELRAGDTGLAARIAARSLRRVTEAARFRGLLDDQ